MKPARMFGDAERQAEWEESQARYAVEQDAIDAADRDREVPTVRDMGWLDDEFDPTIAGVDSGERYGENEYPERVGRDVERSV